MEQMRDRARVRLTSARRGPSPPPFKVDGILGEPAEQVVVVEPTPTIDDGIPRGIRIAGAWAWRIVLFVLAAYLVLRLISVLRLVIIPVAVAVLLAALLEP